MGKVVGLVGAASGKIGNLVYSVTNGIQTARVYQPIVANPKSTGQSLQRAKANLAGRMSSFVPRTAIMGLGTNARLRRGAFLRNVLKKATAYASGSNYTAKIQPRDVLFSKGDVIMPVTLSAVNASMHIVTVALNGISNSYFAPQDYASRLVRLIVMVYEQNTTDLVEVSTKLATMPEQGATATSYLSIAYSESYDVYVYAVPMSTQDGTAASVDTSVVGLDDDVIAASLSVNGNAVAFDYGRSVLLGEGSYTQA